MKRTRAVIASLLPLILLTSCSAPESSHCVLDPEQMPEGWRPSGTVQQALVAEGERLVRDAVDGLSPGSALPGSGT